MVRSATRAIVALRLCACVSLAARICSTSNLRSCEQVSDEKALEALRLRLPAFATHQPSGCKPGSATRSLRKHFGRSTTKTTTEPIDTNPSDNHVWLMGWCWWVLSVGCAPAVLGVRASPSTYRRWLIFVFLFVFGVFSVFGRLPSPHFGG